MANSKNITFDQLSKALAKIKAGLDGKANTSHGTHVSYGTTTTALTSGGKGVVGTSPSVARADHTHTLPAYPTALKSPGTLTINQNDKGTTTYNGASDVTVKITPDSIGAAPASHGQHVLYPVIDPKVAGTAAKGTSDRVAREDHVHPLQTNVSGSSGSCTGNAATATKLQTPRSIGLSGILTGSASFDGSSDITIATAVANQPISGNWFKGILTVTTAGITELGKYLDFHNASTSTADYDVRLQCATANGNTVNLPSNTGTLALLSDNVASATQLKNARTLTIGNTGKSFNGTGNVSWTLDEIGAAAKSHGTHVSYSTTAPLVAGTASAGTANNVSRGDHVHPPQTSVSGNAGTATRLQTARTLKIGETSKTFNGSADVSWSLSEIGAAAKDHGIHVNYSTADPMAHGDTPTPGTSNTVSRGDHVHPKQTSVSGNAGTATKLATARTLTIGNAGKTFDGSTNVSWDLNEIGAIPLTGSTAISGNLEFAQSNTTTRGVIGSVGGNDYWRIVGGATASNSGYLEIATADDASEPIYVRQYGSGKFGTLTRSATLLDASGNTSFPGTVSATGGFSGNASSATKLKTARSINGTNFDGSANITTANWGTARTLTIGNSGKSVNGSGNVSWSLSEIGAAASGHNHDSTYLKLSGGTMTGNITFADVTSTSYPANSSKIAWSGSTDGAEIYYRVTAADKGQLVINLKDDADASIGIALNGTVKTTFDTNGYYSGKANQANTLATARTIKIGNTGKSFNGSKNVSWTLNEIGAASSGHTHNKILDGNSTITINQQNDRSGIDGKNNVDIASWYGVSISNGCSDTENYGQVTFSVDARNGNIWARGTVNAPTFSGSLSGNASSATKLKTARTIKIGNTSRNFDGTANVSWTLGEIGAAAASHTHNYAASSHEHNYLNVKGTSTINSTTNDTTANWGAQKNSVHWYTTSGQLNDQPSQYGYLINIGQNSEVHQIWMQQSSGTLAHRGGNASGWDDSWRFILDSTNYNSYAAAKSHTHDLRQISGGNNADTALGSVYFRNSSTTYYARVSCYHNTDINQDYAHMGIRDANDNMPNYMNLYPDTVRIKSNNIELGGKRLTIATSAPSSPATGDIWIDI